LARFCRDWVDVRCISFAARTDRRELWIAKWCMTDEEHGPVKVSFGTAPVAETRRQEAPEPYRLYLDPFVETTTQFEGNGMRRQRHWSAEEKVTIVVESLAKSEPNIAICRRYRISEPTLYKWRQLFLEGGKLYLDGRGRHTIQDCIEENQRLKQMVAELSLANRRLVADSNTAKHRHKGRDVESV
jgi:transposase-like protein